MLTRIPDTAAVTAICILTAACAAGTNPDVAAREAEEAARAAITVETQAFAQAFRDGDVPALMSRMTDDAVVTTVQGDLRGRTAVEAFYSDFFSTGGSVASLQVTSEPLQIDGDLAIEAGTYEETIVMAGAEPMDVSGSYLMVWKRQPDGAWRIQRFIGVDRMPAE